MAGYTYLVNFGFKEEDTVLCGNLALALTRYLTDNWDKVPHLLQAPSVLVLMFPWGDMNESFEATPAELATESVAHDWASPTNREEMIHTIKTFLWNEPDDITDAERWVYSSPASPYQELTPDSTTRKVWFKDFPRALLDPGGSEVIRDQTRRPGVAMEEDLNKDRVVLNECPGGIRGYISLDWYEPERSGGMRKTIAWLGDA